MAGRRGLLGEQECGKCECGPAWTVTRGQEPSAGPDKLRRSGLPRALTWGFAFSSPQDVPAADRQAALFLLPGQGLEPESLRAINKKPQCIFTSGFNAGHMDRAHCSGGVYGAHAWRVCETCFPGHSPRSLFIPSAKVVGADLLPALLALGEEALKSRSGLSLPEAVSSAVCSAPTWKR